MKRFNCSCTAKAELFFDSCSCVGCGRLTGFSDELQEIIAFDPTETPDVWQNPSDSQRYTQCENYALHGACNGMVKIEGDAHSDKTLLCFACHFNKTIPDLTITEHLPLWKKLEEAKRRTFFTLRSLDLELPDAEQLPEGGLSFEFITDRDAEDHFQSSLPGHEPVFTGHDSGNIVINIAEADEVARTAVKISLAENYRTLLGHFRHEIGHYFWDRLVAPDADELDSYRTLFGDEREDYQVSLDRHYNDGPPANWPDNFISAYATMHPWEDWAETWAHYIHNIDTLETAQAFGFTLKTPAKSGKNKTKNIAIDKLELPQDVRESYFWMAKETPIETIIDTWTGFSVGLNALNRSMGLDDAYPFVLTPSIRSKLAFVHELLKKAAL